jgi:(R)-2-hydroxyacyl-CoA dehydratese activating ATPase
MISAGFDIGTRFIKACIIEGTEILGFAMSEVDREMGKLIKGVYKKALEISCVSKSNVKKILATGYGSTLVRYTGSTLPVAPCIARAVNTINKNIRIVVDVGGLFINIISIDEHGFITDSFTNDRCAAGSGKFLEMVSEAVDVPFMSISDCALSSNNPYGINSSCAVFAESEIISQVNSGRDGCDIMAGVLTSIATRAVTLLGRTDMPGDIALCGGISKIPAFSIIFQRLIEKHVHVLPLDLQIIAAYGAALIAGGESFSRKRKNASIGAHKV